MIREDQTTPVKIADKTEVSLNDEELKKLREEITEQIKAFDNRIFDLYYQLTLSYSLCISYYPAGQWDKARSAMDDFRELKANVELYYADTKRPDVQDEMNKSLVYIEEMLKTIESKLDGQLTMEIDPTSLDFQVFRTNFKLLNDQILHLKHWSIQQA